MMEPNSLYRSKLTTPAEAVGRIASGATLSMGMAMTEPPALLKALADRAAAGKVDDLKIYYFESTRIAGETILRYELADRIQPYCMFITEVERALIKKGMQDGGHKTLTYVPSNFHQSPRLLTEHIGIDTFLVTVSPMDRHGYFTFGTGNDYSSKVARAAKHLIVEVNGQMPRVYGSLAQLHVSEVEVIVENNAPLLELPIPDVGTGGRHDWPGSSPRWCRMVHVCRWVSVRYQTWSASNSVAGRISAYTQRRSAPE